jgi:hypothetical protein
MTELERRALLGDREAQKECTEKGIVLPCPFCGKKAEAFKWGATFEVEIVCQNKECKTSKSGIVKQQENESDEDTYKRAFQSALSNWNTRPAPPIGQCGTCKHYYNVRSRCNNPKGIVRFNDTVKADDYCSYYEPREVKMMIARVKKTVTENIHCYGDLFGVGVVLNIFPEQKWKVRKSGGYYWLTRKGGMTLRLTETALCRLFDLEEEQ